MPPDSGLKAPVLRFEDTFSAWTVVKETWFPHLLTDKEKLQIDRRKHAALDADAVGAMRHWAKEGLGFNCTFVDDDMKLLVTLAQRAVLAGLAEDADPATLKLFKRRAEQFRGAHEQSLGFALPIGRLK